MAEGRPTAVCGCRPHRDRRRRVRRALCRRRRHGRGGAPSWVPRRRRGGGCRGGAAARGRGGWARVSRRAGRRTGEKRPRAPHPPPGARGCPSRRCGCGRGCGGGGGGSGCGSGGGNDDLPAVPCSGRRTGPRRGGCRRGSGGRCGVSVGGARLLVLPPRRPLPALRARGGPRARVVNSPRVLRGRGRLPPSTPSPSPSNKKKKEKNRDCPWKKCAHDNAGSCALKCAR